jgi:TonB-linked SusC/RagA family outer membrane protein
MKLKLLMLMMACVMAFKSYGQGVIIKGKVLDETGKGLPGATLSLKESTTRTATNSKGEFSITVPNAKTAVLNVGYVGYKTQTVNVDGKQTLVIRLTEDASSLNEVVVTALNISRDSKSLGYARQGINTDELTEARDINITNMLEGKVAGLQIITSGQATGSTKVLLRGINSVSGNNEPLWVVDGIPIDNSHGQNGGIGNLDYGNGASAVNPDDIESMEVLKGPNAAALYGSSAANGAILITTKKGKKSKGFGISFNSNFMVNTISEYPEYQNVYGEGADSHMANINRIDLTNPNAPTMRMGNDTRSFGAPMLGQPYASYSGVPGEYRPQPNNILDFYNSSFTGVQNLSFSAGDGTSSFRASYTYTNGNDVIEGQNIVNRHNLALNGSKNFSPWLRIDTRLQYFDEKVENRVSRNLDANSPMNAASVMMRSFRTNDLIPWKDASGNSFAYTATSQQGYENPYWSLNENYNADKKNRVIGGVTATVGLFKDLKFRTQIAADLTFGNAMVFIDKGGLRNPLGQYREFTDNNQNWNIEGLFMYNKTLNKHFTLSANLGGNLNNRNTLRVSGQTNSLQIHDMMNMANSAVLPTIAENPSKFRKNSVFGTATLGYNNYLFLDVTGRNDWSSSLGPENWSFFYPSVSGSFVFSDFLKIPAKSVLSFGKIRASYAKVGKDTNPYALRSSFQTDGIFNGLPILNYENTFKNPDLKPEQTSSTELGLDLRFLNNRISLDATVYKSSTSNQIFDSQVPVETGFTNRIVNAGEIENKGIELTLNATAIKTKNVTWGFTANWSANRNKVISLADGINKFRLGGVYNVSVNAIVGRPIGDLLGIDFYRDASGKVIVNDVPSAGTSYGRPYPDADVYLGNFQPKWLGSIGSNVRYKNFDFSFNVSVKMGGSLYSGSQTQANFLGTSLMSIDGRDDFYFSNVILGESGTELAGITQLYNKPYPDAARRKGMQTVGYSPKRDASGNLILDANGRMIADKVNVISVNPFIYWPNAQNMSSLMIYDASYVKLNQLIFGFTAPSKWLLKSPFQSARLAFVARNVWTIYKKTPRGIDPESANTSGNALGLEQGGSLPFVNYGFDLKLSF